MVGPEQQRRDRRTVRGRGPQDPERRIQHLWVSRVAQPEMVVGLGDVQAGRPQFGDRLGDGRRGLIDHQVVPLVVDVEGGVGAVVVVVGGDRDLQPIGHRRADQRRHPLTDDIAVSAEDHVEVGGDHDRDVLALLGLERHRRDLHVVVDPVRVGVAIAHRHTALVPRGHEEPGRERVLRIGNHPGEVVVGTVDRRQHRPGRRADLDHGGSAVRPRLARDLRRRRRRRDNRHRQHPDQHRHTEHPLQHEPRQYGCRRRTRARGHVEPTGDIPPLPPSGAVGQEQVRGVSATPGSTAGSEPDCRPSAVRTSRWRNRNARSSNRLRRSQPVTSSLHLLALHGPQAGTTLSSVYRPPREIASTQSRCSGRSVAPQYAHPPHVARSAIHCTPVRSWSTRAIRR